MNPKSWFCLGFLPILCSCNLPENRQAPSIESMLNDHGIMDGCSWYCSAPPIHVNATSTFHDGIYSYDAPNAHDSRKDTVWVEGASGPGIGERLIFNFDMTHHRGFSSDPDAALGINEVSIINGFARTPKLWAANGRVKTLRVIYNGKDLGTIVLQDTIKAQSLKLPKITFRPGRANKVEFEIVEVYPGTQHEDTALADFYFSGFCTGPTH